MEVQVARYSWVGSDGAVLEGLRVKKDFGQCQC